MIARRLMDWRILLLLIVTLALFLIGSATKVGSSNSTLPARSTQPVIAWHFVLKPISMDAARRLVDVAGAAGFNTVVVQLAGGVAFDNSPWSTGDTAWTKMEFLDWIAYARAHGMVVIPEIKLLSQQKKFFQKSHPDLMFNAATYDPRNEDVYTQVFKFLDELIDVMHPPAIHIGHDEVAGFRKYSAKKYLRRGEVVLPANLFLEDVLKLHEYLSTHDVETWMWGDMLLSEKEFPSMSRKGLHGSLPGYGEVLRKKLPRDIVICDWQYNTGEKAEFASLSTMMKEGFRVIATTFHHDDAVRDFSAYAAKHRAYGAMATTFFYVSRKDWEAVDNILIESGKTFNQDFANEK